MSGLRHRWSLALQANINRCLRNNIRYYSNNNNNINSITFKHCKSIIVLYTIDSMNGTGRIIFLLIEFTSSISFSCYYTHMVSRSNLIQSVFFSVLIKIKKKNRTAVKMGVVRLSQFNVHRPGYRPLMMCQKYRRHNETLYPVTFIAGRVSVRVIYFQKNRQ